jgi:Putative diphthamide synthesis protein
VFVAAFCFHGTLFATLLASYLPLISHLRKILTKAQKKSYTISVGKLNPAKLGNFMEIECFVLVACPENSLIDAKVSIKKVLGLLTSHYLHSGLFPTDRDSFRARDCVEGGSQLDGPICSRF